MDKEKTEKHGDEQKETEGKQVYVQMVEKSEAS